MVKKMKRILSIFLSVLFVVTCFTAVFDAGVVKVHAETTEKENNVSRLINVVYDDSNSMLLHQRLWWCYAKYSMEVFSAMMQEKDTMNIYYMSQFYHKSKSESDSIKPAISGLSGKESNRQSNIDAIHKKATDTSGTPIQSVRKALDDLKKGSSSYTEKWLIIITDGTKFDDEKGSSFGADESKRQIDEMLRGVESYGIKVVYLAIRGDGDEEMFVPDSSDSVFVYNANGDVADGRDGILNQVTEICQRVFQRPNMLGASGSTLKFDVPVSEIVVLAQGENVNVGSISGTKKSSAQAKIRKSEASTISSTNGNKTNAAGADLNGTIVTFTPSNGAFLSEGTYNLSISADEYTVYYKPYLDVVLDVYNSKGEKVTDREIPTGNYSFEYWLTYPYGHEKYGEKLSSSVIKSLGSIDYELTCTVDGKTREITSSRTDLSEGNTEIKVTATYLNFISNSTANEFVVENWDVEELEVSLVYPVNEGGDKYVYELSTLENDKNGVTVEVTRGGSKIPSSEWSAFTAAASGDGISFNAVKNNDSTFTLYPRYCDGQISKTDTGKVRFKVTIESYKGSRVTARGSADGEIEIYNDTESVSLKVSGQTEYKLSELENGEGLTVEVSRDGEVITGSDWSAYELRCEADGLKFNVTKNDDGTFTVLPAYNGTPKDTATGDVTVTFTAKADKNGITVTGSAEETLNISNDLMKNLVIGVEHEEHYTNKNITSEDPEPYADFSVRFENGDPFTEEQYNNLVLEFDLDSEYIRIDRYELDPFTDGGTVTGKVYYKVEKESDGSYPAPKHLYGDFDCKVKAETTYGDFGAGGEYDDVLEVSDNRTFLEKFLDYLPFILILLAILFIIFAYFPIFKKYLPRKIYYRGSIPIDEPAKFYSKGIGIITMLIPFMKMKGNIAIEVGNDTLVLKLTALGKTKVKCEVDDELIKDRYRIQETLNISECKIKDRYRNSARIWQDK